MAPRYEHIIAGGGASGMALACQLLESPRLSDRPLLLVDRDPHDDERRTFSFWCRRPTVFDGTACRVWTRLAVEAPGWGGTVDLGAYRYLTIRGVDFQRYARGLLRDRPGAELREGTVEDVHDTVESAAIKVDGEWIEGRWVFDSRPPSRRAGARPPKPLLRQRFRGWEVETEADAFDPEVATFFDFRTPQRGAVRFFYVLPYTARSALVEHVVYGEGLEREDLDRYVREVLGLSSFTVRYDEAGASPLFLGRARRRPGRNVLRIGVRGGRLKASTGYAFRPILRDSAAIVRSLETRGHPFDLPREPGLFRLLDALMLRVMVGRPEVIPAAFASMFAKNPIERVLRFLDEEAGLGEVLRLGLTLPTWPFVAEAARAAVGLRPRRR